MLLAAGCGGGGVTPDAPTLSTAPQAVSAFLRAAADSNLTQMGALWGTSGGVVSRTEANEKRLVVLQAYLKGDSTRILADEPVPASSNQRRVTVALYRSTCVKQFPVIAVRQGNGGWLVTNVDLNLTGNPARPCEP
jgi:hypothetical protein